MIKIKIFPDILASDVEKKWNEFHTAASAADIHIQDDVEQREHIRYIFGLSDFIARTCIRHPGILDDLFRSGDIDKKYEPNEYYQKIQVRLSNIENSEILGKILRQIRWREMVRIAWRDLSGRADLSETMNDLSNFADACIEHSLSRLYEWQCSKFGVPVSANGSPQHLVVIGMGKLGAKELNFSSDIDLIFAYPEVGATKSENPISNDEFFVKLSRELFKVLDAKTSDGILFRVDMNLRPYGESGAIAMSFDAMDSYYQRQGREWERYAWIKARTVAGDKAAGDQLLKFLNPFIYRRYLDFGVFESLRDMKQKIALEVRRKGMKGNIKLGRGGIREIEFFGQIFQLIRGGVLPELQERSIQKVLLLLAEEGYIEPDVCQELKAAYLFLRYTEHRLQEFSDQQTHQLPLEPVGQMRLAISMGFENWESFATKLKEHRDTVHYHFDKLLLKDSNSHDTKTENDLKSVWHHLEDEHNMMIMADAGFDEPDAALQLLNHLKNDLSNVIFRRESRERIDKLIPLLLEELADSEQSTLGLNRIIELIKTIKKRPTYVSLLLENPTALTHLVRLAIASSWILSFLTLHPVVLDELLDSRTLYVPPRRDQLEKEIRHRMDQIPDDDLEYQMETLCVFKQASILRVAAADITDALPLMKVSDHLSDIAEIILHKVIKLSWYHLTKKHGKPDCYIPCSSPSQNSVPAWREECDRGFVVIAYGKLGGFELGYDSDLDMVFLHAGTRDYTKGGAHPIDVPQFFARMGQRIIHILGTRTNAGVLYQTDMRLRPSGNAGPLVSHIESFREYQMKNAWTWEKQALIRARAIIGDKRLITYFEEMRKEVLAQPRVKAKLQEEVRNMRQRMRKELSHPKSGYFDLKQDPGGIVDIEFIVQYLVLLHAHEYPGLLKWTDNVRLLGTLAKAGIIKDNIAYFLRTAYLAYRTIGHQLSLQKQPAQVSKERFADLRKRVKEIWDDFLES